MGTFVATEPAPTPTGMRSAISAHAALAGASAAVIAAVARLGSAITFDHVAIWFAATGIATGIVVVPLERLLVTHRLPGRGSLGAAALLAAALAATAGALTNPQVAVFAGLWSATHVVVATRRAAFIRNGNWSRYRATFLAESAVRGLAVAAVIAAPHSPGLVIATLTAGAGAAAIASTVRRPSAASRPATVAMPATLTHLMLGSAAATWLIQGVVIVQQVRAPQALPETVTVAVAARAALWASPALSAVAARHAWTAPRSRNLRVLIYIPFLTLGTVAGSALLDGKLPPLTTAAIATAATAMTLAAFTLQQAPIARGRASPIARTWIVAAALATAAWTLFPATPTVLFAIQALAAGLVAAAFAAGHRRHRVPHNGFSESSRPDERRPSCAPDGG